MNLSTDTLNTTTATATSADAVSSPFRFAYQAQDSTLTLREGLQEYYRVNPGLVDADQASDLGKQFFQSHDICHVIFGTDTSLGGEGLTDWWTIMAVDITLRAYVAQAFKADEVKQVVKDIPVREWVRALLTFFTVFPRVRRGARQMSKKWPWTGFEQHLDRPLGELRREYGITVIAP